MKKTIYYAHSMHLYGKPQEQRDIVLLKEMGFEVINPSDERYKKGFKAWNELYPQRKNYMDYFENLVANSDMLAFRAYPDGSIPAGVVAEIKSALANNKAIIELPNFNSGRFLSVEDTKLFLNYLGQR